MEKENSHYLFFRRFLNEYIDPLVPSFIEFITFTIVKGDIFFYLKFVSGNVQ